MGFPLRREASRQRVFGFLGAIEAFRRHRGVPIREV
jgi:hypothetical protein